MTRNFLASIMVLALVATVVGVAANAADTGEVAATVTSELVSVTVASGSVNYGILALNTSANTVDLTQTQVVTNDGNVNVDLDVKSSDAAGGTPWNLAASTGSLDEFTHEFAPDGTTWTSFAINNDYASLATAVTTTQNLDLKITTPTSVTDNVLKTITVTVLATAS